MNELAETQERLDKVKESEVEKITCSDDLRR